MEALIIPALILGIFLLYKFTKSFEYTLITILLTSAINCWLIEIPTIKIGLNLYPNDPLFIIIFFSALLRLIMYQQYRNTSMLWNLYGLQIFILFFMGLSASGTLAGVEFRGYFYLWAGTLYFMTFHYSTEMLDRFLKIWITMCLIFLAITYFRFVAEALHLPIMDTWHKDDPTGVKFRVIKGNHASILSIGVVILFLQYVVPERKKPSKILTVLFVVAVIVLQHRSVWMQTITAILSALILPKIKASRMIGNLVIIGIVGFILLLPLLWSSYGDVILGSVTDLAQKGTHLESGTFGDRVRGWTMVLEAWNKLSLTNKLLGLPMAEIAGSVNVKIHSFYVQMLDRLGVLGLIILLSFYLLLLAKLYFSIKHHPQHTFYFALFFMLIIGVLVFYIPYAIQPEQCVILGIAYSIITQGPAKSKSTETAVKQNQQYYLNTPKIKFAKPANINSH